MYTFQRNDEIIVINGSEIRINLFFTADKLKTSWVAKIPSLNIIAYADSKEDAELNINSSVTSFFRYWMKTQGQQAFFEHLGSLGFTLTRNQKSVEKLISRRSAKDIAMTLAV